MDIKCLIRLRIGTDSLLNSFEQFLSVHPVAAMPSLWKIIIAFIVSSLLRASGQKTRPATDIQPNVVYYVVQTFQQGSAYERNSEQAIQQAISDFTGRIFQVGSGDTAVYSTAECYNNNDCPRCLSSARSTIKDVSPTTLGAQYFLNFSGYSCYLRFEPYNFGPAPAPAPRTFGFQNPPESSPPSFRFAYAEAPAQPRGLSPGSAFSVGILVGVLVGVIVSSSVSVALLWFCIRRQRNRRRRKRPLLPVIQGASNFDYHELEAATDGFNETNKLGQGAFGAVYKGSLKDGCSIAVKQLDVNSRQGQREFLNEIQIITHIQHKNLVKLKGYCIYEDEKLLVYEYLPNKSLDKALFRTDTGIFLDWPARMQIIVGIASGLAYLHEESQQGIIHRDIKASNVLLDEKLHPKISDFGISKLFNHDQEFTNTIIAGTFGYLAPECLQGARLTTKADVYSFGVLVLEIVSGRKCILRGEEQLLKLTWILESRERLIEIVDKQVDSTKHSDEILRVINIALACAVEEPASRPLMSEVVAMLSGYKEPPILPRYVDRKSFYDVNIFSDASTPKVFSDSSSLLRSSTFETSLSGR